MTRMSALNRLYWSMIASTSQPDNQATLQHQHTSNFKLQGLSSNQRRVKAQLSVAVITSTTVHAIFPIVMCKKKNNQSRVALHCK